MGLSIKLSENGGRAPEAVPYMPAGESVIDASVNGAPGRRRVVATREACERLQRDLEEHLKASEARQKARPLVMFDHKTDGGAAAVPLGFEWDDERGILLRVEWTQAGREAVEGGNYGYISPSFRLQRGTGEILGLAGGVEIGSLVNDPAFEKNECIAASKEDVPEVVTVYAANPYGCNQHGHGFVGECELGSGGQKTFDFMSEKKAKEEEKKDQQNKSKKPDYSFSTALKNTTPRERDEKGNLLSVDDLEPLEIVKLENEQRDKRAEYSENNRKIERLNKELREAEKTAAASRSAKDKKQVEKIKSEWRAAKKKQDELTQRLRVIHKIFNPSWEIKASFVEVEKENTDVLPPHNFTENVGEMGENIGVSGEGVGAENRNNNKKNMEEIAKLLGLPADADAATICSKIAAMQKESGEAKKRIEEVEAEKEEHKNALHKHKEEAADAFVKRQKNEGKIAPHDKERLEAARAMYLADSANAELIFAGMRRVDNVREDGKVDTADQVQAAAAKNYENLSLAELLAAEK